MGDKCACVVSLVKSAEACPGRGAAFFMPLRRAGTVPDTAFVTIPVLRSSAKSAASRPGHEANYRPRSFSKTSDDANPSAGVPIEAWKPDSTSSAGPEKRRRSAAELNLVLTSSILQ
jgi:hypothetical protein